MEKVNLCTPCAELMKLSFDVKLVRHGVNEKINCAHCGRRRYGGAYEVSKKGELNGKNVQYETGR